MPNGECPGPRGTDQTMAKDEKKKDKKKSVSKSRYKSVLTGPVGTKEPRFLHDLPLDNVVGALIALAGEVYILRDRVQTLEAVLTEAKTIAPDAVENFKESPEKDKARNEDAKKFVNRVLRELHRSDVPVSKIGRKAREMV